MTASASTLNCSDRASKKANLLGSSSARYSSITSQARASPDASPRWCNSCLHLSIKSLDGESVVAFRLRARMSLPALMTEWSSPRSQAYRAVVQRYSLLPSRTSRLNALTRADFQYSEALNSAHALIATITIKKAIQTILINLQKSRLISNVRRAITAFDNLHHQIRRRSTKSKKQ